VTNYFLSLHLIIIQDFSYSDMTSNKIFHIVLYFTTSELDQNLLLLFILN